jgi:hypothetical protein
LPPKSPVISYPLYHGTSQGRTVEYVITDALLDAQSPLNILKEIPEPTAQFDYRPLWDIHLVRWNDSVPVANRLRQTDFATAQV